MVLGLCGVDLRGGFGGFGDGSGQDRVGSRVNVSGFWAWWVALGHGGLGLGAGRMVWVWADSFWACAGWCRDWAGVMGFGNVVLGFGVGQVGFAGWWVRFWGSMGCVGAWGIGIWDWRGGRGLGWADFGFWRAVGSRPRKN